MRALNRGTWGVAKARAPLLHHSPPAASGFSGAMASPQGLFVRLQYPQSIGPLSEDELDNFLRSIQKVSSMDPMVA